MTQRDQSNTEPLDTDLRQVDRPLRRYRVLVEVVMGGEWKDVQAKIYDACDEEWPGAAIAADLVEETLLVPWDDPEKPAAIVDPIGSVRRHDPAKAAEMQRKRDNLAHVRDGTVRS